MKLHRKGVKTWRDLDLQYWKSIATLISQYDLFNRQLNLTGQRIDQWERGDLWLMTITQKPQIDAFVWKGSNALWPIPKGMYIIAMQGVLNCRWKTLKDRYQWTIVLHRLRSKNIEPKKSCLVWLIAYRAIWTNKKALKVNKGNGLCMRCKKEEDDIHIFFQCERIVPFLDRIKRIIESEGRARWSVKSLIIGDPVGCSNGLCTVLRVEILWWLWLARLDAIYGGLKEDFGMLKERLIKVGEGYCSETIVKIDS